MNKTAQRIVDEAGKLPAEDLLQVVVRLQEKLLGDAPGSSGEWTAAWAEEAERRSQELSDGTVTGVDADETLLDMRIKLHAARQMRK